MKHLLRLRLVPALVLTFGLGAAPVDIKTGLITGAHVNTRSSGGVQSDGIEIEYPVWEWILDKEYTYREVPYHGNERDEAYVGLGPTRDYGFASGTATGLGDIEVGAANPIRTTGGIIAASRYNFKIKNNLNEPISYLFEFYIHRGLLEVDGIRSDHTLHARVEAMIDYVLLTPAGPFGGHYDETSGRLFTYYADVGFDNRLTHSNNADVTLLEKNDFTLKYSVDPYNGKLWLPEIPSRGEITLYYDMYAHLNVQRFEVGGFAMLGDPMDLTGGPGIRLTQVAAVPEPASILLWGTGFIALRVLRRK
jgi:hypothetical protein